MKRLVMALLPLALVIACSKPAANRNAASEVAAADAAAGPGIAAAVPPSGTGMPPPSGAPMLAYDYSATLAVPDGRVPALVSRHQQACNAAGPGLCQVLNSSITTDRGTTTAELKLRAEPRWLARFRAGLAQDARGAGGSLARSGVESEDLTRSMVDTEAALRAKTTLRDRLEKLLAEHPGKMSDLLAIEKQLAETQGEIDAAQSELAVMRGRITMSTMTISYGSHAHEVGSRSRPFADAIQNFGTVMAFAAGAIVYLVAFLIPFSVVIVPIVWLLRRRAQKRRQAKAAAPPPT